MRQVRSRTMVGQLKTQQSGGEPVCFSPESSKRLKRKLNRKKRRKRMQVLSNFSR